MLPFPRRGFHHALYHEPFQSWTLAISGTTRLLDLKYNGHSSLGDVTRAQAPYANMTVMMFYILNCGRSYLTTYHLTGPQTLRYRLTTAMCISNRSSASSVQKDVLDPRNTSSRKKSGKYVHESSRREDGCAIFVAFKQGNSWQEPLRPGRHLELKYQGKSLESPYCVHKSKSEYGINLPTVLYVTIHISA